MFELDRPTPIGADPLLVETVDRLLSERCPPAVGQALEVTGRADGDLWTFLSEAGLTSVGSAEGHDDGGIVDAVAVLRACGEFAAPVPIAEHGLLAGWLVQRAGAELPGAMCTVPIGNLNDEIVASSGRVRGRFARVPYADSATHLVTAIEGSDSASLVVVSADQLHIQPSKNLAGEPRDVVEIDVPVTASLAPGTMAAMWRRGTLGRVALMTGAMRRAVQLAAVYSRDRHQFGRPIAGFQAVQHMLALAAEHLINAEAACWVAADALATDEADPSHHVDVARVITHEAMEVVSHHCHQVFGAIGVTKEHELHLYTRRLWAWDLEWSASATASARIARWLAGVGGAERWGALAGVGADS